MINFENMDLLSIMEEVGIDADIYEYEVVRTNYSKNSIDEVTIQEFSYELNKYINSKK